MNVIHGYLNYGNYGDELLAEIVEQKILEAKPGALVKRLSSKSSFKEHLDCLLYAKNLYIVGGVLQDETSFLSFLYYFFVYFLFKLFGAKVHFLAVGLGPFYFPLSYHLSMWLLKSASYVSVRDQHGSELLEEANIKHEYLSDLVFSLDVPETEIGIEEDFEHPAFYYGKENIVLCLRNLKLDNINQVYADIFEQIAMNFSNRESPNIIFLLMQDSDEHVIYNFIDYYSLNYGKQLDANIIRAQDFKALELINFLAQCDLIVSMRLHALILAHMAQIHLVAIIINVKLQAFLQEVNTFDDDELQARAKGNFEIIK